jgi:HTH-type transcriptional regulator/antitoxin HigA
MATERIWPDVAIPPGETLAETLGTMGVSQAELARRAGRPVQAVNEIVRGTKAITAETALQLERVLGVPATFWTRLEENYRLNKARLEDRKRLAEEVHYVRRYPYATMARLGWVRKVASGIDRVDELLRFFGVASLKDAPAVVAQLRKAKRKPSREALAAWVRQGQRLADNIEARPYDERALREVLIRLRELATEEPEIFEPELRKRLAECGVVLVLLPHLPKTYAHGATSWLRSDRAIVQMSIRCKWADIFWFSLFHELAHVLLHGRREVFIEYDNGEKSGEEREADEFAGRALIPKDAYQRFVRECKPLSVRNVEAFARENAIAPGIVVGRLQHDGLVPYSHLNALRVRLQWARKE